MKTSSKKRQQTQAFKENAFEKRLGKLKGQAEKGGQIY